MSKVDKLYKIPPCFDNAAVKFKMIEFLELLLVWSTSTSERFQWKDLGSGASAFTAWIDESLFTDTTELLHRVLWLRHLDLHLFTV
jgi:hypothetical protein